LCSHAWEPHRASAVKITHTFAISLQELVFGHMFSGTFFHISAYHTHWNTGNVFLLKFSGRNLLPLYFTLEIIHNHTFQQLYLQTVMWVRLT
jgi:hypothetical protein